MLYICNKKICYNWIYFIDASRLIGTRFPGLGSGPLFLFLFSLSREEVFRNQVEAMKLHGGFENELDV